jgi:hypothetical protein
VANPAARGPAELVVLTALSGAVGVVEEAAGSVLLGVATGAGAATAGAGAVALAAQYFGSKSGICKAGERWGAASTLSALDVQTMLHTAKHGSCDIFCLSAL